MSQHVCRICLRSDFVRTVPIDKKLSSFYGELGDFGLNQSASRFCILCEHQLKKFYNFRQQCRRANKLLKSCGQKKNLQPSPYLGFVSHTNQQAVYHYFYIDPRTMTKSDIQKLHRDKVMGNNPISSHDHVYEAAETDDRLPIIEEIDVTDNGVHDFNEINLEENYSQLNQYQKQVIQGTGSQKHDLQDTDIPDADITDADVTDADVTDADVTDTDMQDNDNQRSDSSGGGNFMEMEFLDSDLEEDKEITKANQKQETKRKSENKKYVSCRKDLSLLDENDEDVPKADSHQKRLGKINWVEIDPYKGSSRWFAREGHFYVVCRARGPTLSLRCANKRCPVRWSLKRGVPGLLSNNHNHTTTPWIPDRNAMFQSLKRRSTSEPVPLSTIYEEEAARYPDAASYLLWDNVGPSMRKWRRVAHSAR